jgi:diguanylate cyclase (GGDEF)-like protein
VMRVTKLKGPAPGVIVSHVNITRRKMAEQELAHAASHDPLSGLANRTLLNARLTAALDRRRDARPERDIGVLYIDLDDFKVVNDRFGHAAGDEVLLNVTKRLRGTIRAGDTIARIGGDEFAVIVPDVDRRELAVVAAKVGTVLAPPHRIHGQWATVTGSVGMHLAESGEVAADALRQADQAMYAAKQARVRPTSAL